MEEMHCYIRADMLEKRSDKEFGSLYNLKLTNSKSVFKILTTNCVTATLGTPEQRLRHNLSQDYHPTVRPVLTPNDIINITFSFRFSRIVSLDIKNQVLTTDAWIVQA
ncbi:hypothetical protein pdam_00012508 [Pocillopora damicornis]|uniref:Neurotransmitter-gated ion-channel ligand-binding domain-containing protein n=1 Tax=Pocillopora damicornis TaxID=46731 RepID=A0A3M6UXF1_POCDA|nr:hypothetical protein pdam_00012508 [Pocillopora damicornis]